jgi:carbon-monoxide dehydrogenase medium subunit
MKPAPFKYARAETTDQVFELLEQYGDEARLLAGGQSLMATLNMRLSTPQLLIDINRIDGLAGIDETDSVIRIGAMTRQVDIEYSQLIAGKLPLLAQALPYIGHPAIRNRGTLGGSIAFADPAAELPACAVALNAVCVLAGRDGERRVAAEEFFLGLYETALQAGEMLSGVEFPKPAENARSEFMELARRHGDYAMVGLALYCEVADGRIANSRPVFFGVGDRPVLSRQVAAVLDGEAPTAATIKKAQGTLDQDLQPLPDLHASVAMKRHLAKVLLERVLAKI